MEEKNLFDRLGSVLKDYIDDEDFQKQNRIKAARAETADNGGGTKTAKKEDTEHPNTIEREKGFTRQSNKKRTAQSKRSRGIIYKAVSAEVLEDFRVLGLSPAADFQTCKKQYKKLLHLYHPDKYKTGTEEQKQANTLTMRIRKAFKNIENRFSEHIK